MRLLPQAGQVRIEVEERGSGSWKFDMAKPNETVGHEPKLYHGQGERGEAQLYAANPAAKCATLPASGAKP
jgi:hypothetical protein